MTVQETIRKLALINAQKFKGQANPKALIGSIIREHPESKDDMAALQKDITTIVASVNGLSIKEQHEELLKLDPSFEKKQQEGKQSRKEKRSSLPDLPNAIDGKVITRIPPEPSKYNHLGHAMSFLINYLYAKKYHGKVVLRFEDTNPEKETQEFVDAMNSDVVEYLDIQADSVVFASDHMDTYYEIAQSFIRDGQAYVCQCQQSEISAMRRSGIDCPHRNRSIMENQLLWKKMKSGQLAEGSHVLRLKIDMQHKNAVMRDPVIYRLSYTPHYRQGEKYKVWPMYDFENAVEEGLCEVTHVMRSNEFDQRIELQHYIAKLLKFPKVTYKHYGRYNVIGASTQGREIRALIDSGKYIGWDDPRLVTLRALKRRGILREAYYKLAQKIGLSKTQTNLDFSVIAAVNRSLLDKSAKRFFAVRNPIIVRVKNIPKNKKFFNLAFHPDGEKGERKLPVTEEYYIEQEDNNSIEVGGIVRFMDAMNIKKVRFNEYEYFSESYDDYRVLTPKPPIVHFIPKNGDELKAEILLPDITLLPIICEQNISLLKPDAIIQFERYAFVRFDHVKEDGTIQFWYTHD